MKYTGERCVPEFMSGAVKIYQCHLARYNFALIHARNKKVLDASCGCGFGTDILYDICKDILGVDISEEAIEYARKRYRGRFEVIDLDRDFPGEDFDIVVSFETMEHLDNPDFFIENVKKHSKEFLFSIPIGGVNRFHKKLYSREDIKNLAEKHFKKTRWNIQRGMNFSKHLRERGSYLIGYAKL